MYPAGTKNTQLAKAIQSLVRDVHVENPSDTNYRSKCIADKMKLHLDWRLNTEEAAVLILIGCQTENYKYDPQPGNPPGYCCCTE